MKLSHNIYDHTEHIKNFKNNFNYRLGHILVTSTLSAPLIAPHCITPSYLSRKQWYIFRVSILSSGTEVKMDALK